MVLSLLPNHLEVDYLSRAFTSLTKFDSVTVMLQRDGMSFVESREIFDLFLRDYPEFQHHIGDAARIIQDEVFEKVVMRISRGLPLSEEQRVAAQLLVKPEEQLNELEIPSAENNDVAGAPESYSQTLQRQLKRQKREAGEQPADIYINLPGRTSVNCERLFSIAKFILSDTRKRTNPELFEALLLLKVNRDYWNMYSVGEASMGRTTAINDVPTVPATVVT